MNLPLCKCGHDAFVHSPRPSHCCIEGNCSCVRFDAAVPPAPTADHLSVVNSPNFPAQPKVPAIGNNGELENFIAAANQQPSPWPDAAERRRYALLQAAGVMLSSMMSDEPSAVELRRKAYSAVWCAEALLAEIERREAATEAK